MNLGSFFVVDVRDISNWIGVLIAVPLIWWGLSTIISAAKGG